METLRLGDGQQIYILGKMDSEIGIKYANEASWSDFNNRQDTQYLQNFIVNRYIKHHLPDMKVWLKEYECWTCGWVDPLIFWNKFQRDYKFGIGFKPGDELESLFVLRWS